MIYTCSHHNYQSNLYKTYAISGNRGQDANYQGECFSKLAPKLSFWQIWHNNIGIVSEEENNKYYIAAYYNQVLKKLNPQEIYQQLDNSILLCYEKNNEFCHRHIVAAWLELSLNIPIPEVKIINSQITIVSRPSYIKNILKNIIQKDQKITSGYQMKQDVIISDYETIINRNHLLSPSYIPKDLIATDNNENNFHQFINPTLKPMICQSIYPAYLQMKQDMEKQGLYIIVDSGYRSYDYQQQIINYKIQELGLEKTLNLVAPPGASEHQTGLAFDIALIRNNRCCFDIQETDLEVLWLIKNSYKYGFILRYPRGKEHITTYMFEPWHYRYVGPRLAELLTKYNLTMEEYYQHKHEYDELYNKTVKSQQIHAKIKKRCL